MTDGELRSLFDTLRQENAALRQENGAAHIETRRHAEVLTEDTRRYVAVLNQETRLYVEVLNQETRLYVEVLNQETRRHFEVLHEGTRHEVRLVGDAVATVREELGRRIDALDQKVDRTTAETHALIKFSHADLDRRLRALEGT